MLLSIIFVIFVNTNVHYCGKYKTKNKISILFFQYFNVTETIARNLK